MILFEFTVTGNDHLPKTQHAEDGKAKEATTPTDVEQRNNTEQVGKGTSVDVTITTRSVHFQDLVADDKKMDISEAAEIFLERLESSTSSDITRTSRAMLHQNIRHIHPLANTENFLLMFFVGATAGVMYLYREDIMKNHIPLQVVVLWLTLFFLEGYIVAENRCDAAYKVVLDQMQEQLNLLSQSSLPNATTRSEDASCGQQRRTLLESVLRLNYSPERVEVPSMKDKRTLILPKGFFSCLQNDSVEPSVSEILTKRLLRSACHTKTPDGMGIIPVCKYRGMDILLTDSPEDPIYKNKYLNELVVSAFFNRVYCLLYLWIDSEFSLLIMTSFFVTTLRSIYRRCGLRDVPTLILNVNLAWANIVLYYEMPHWVKNFDFISINESDPDDIKVFKVRYVYCCNSWTCSCVPFSCQRHFLNLPFFCIFMVLRNFCKETLNIVGFECNSYLS